MRFLNKWLLLILILLLGTFLRLWNMDKVPVSLFGDELDVGYQAYSILKTGKDYSGNFMPIHFRSLAEWRTPLYLYSSVPTVAIFGISPLGVRLPAAIFGILSILAIYFLTKEITSKDSLSLLAAFLLTISPWHLQYSRAGFEVTQMLFFYIFGIYFFLRGLVSPKLLYVSAFFLGLTPWAYSTAKLFLPLTVLALILIWWPSFKGINKTSLIKAIVVFTIVVGPFAWNTLFGGGTQRIEGISIFNDPTIVPQMGFDRVNDTKMRGNNNAQADLTDKLFHNQAVSYTSIFLKNYFQAFSTDFLFIRGDIDSRQSTGTGEFFKVEALFLFLGLMFLFFSDTNIKLKVLLGFWLLVAPIPSALTKDGGIHATRLILILPVLIIIISLGVYNSYFFLNRKLRPVFLGIFSIFLLFNFVFYLHDYYIHYPWRSQRWWHAGFQEAMQSAKILSGDYDKVIISQADEPALIFFLSWTEYPPERFQKEYLDRMKNSNSEVKLGKYAFPPVGKGYTLYDLGKNIPAGALYIATQKEIVLNLNDEPKRIPSDVKLVKTVNYPSGNPAFYFFTKP